MDWKTIKYLTQFDKRNFTANVIEYRDEHVEIKLIELITDHGRIVLGENDLKDMLKELEQCT